MNEGSAVRRTFAFPCAAASSAGSSCGYVAHGAVVRLKVIVKISGDLLEISLNRLLSIGGGYARAWNCQGRGDRKASGNEPYQASSLAGHPCLDHWRSRRNREYRTPRVGRSHFGGGGSGSRSAVPTYPQPPHKWTTSPDSGRTGGSLRASRIASPHWGHRGADSGSFRTSIELGEHDGRRISRRAVSARARQPNTAAPVAEKLVFGPVLLASTDSR